MIMSLKRRVKLNHNIYLIEKNAVTLKVLINQLKLQGILSLALGKYSMKFFQQKFTLLRAARADADPQSTLFKACWCLFGSSKKAFRSYLMILKGPLAIWLRFLTVEISDVPNTGEVVGLLLWKLESVWSFWNPSLWKASIMYTIPESNFKFAMLIKSYNSIRSYWSWPIPFNPLSPNSD